MKRRRRTPLSRLLALAVCVALVAVACGGTGGNSAGSSGVASVTPAASTAASPSAPSSSPLTDLNTLIAAAKQEGTVTFYSAAVEAQNDPLVNAFKAAYGINVDVQRQASAPLVTKLLAEFQTGNVQADVVNISNYSTLDQLNVQGSLTSLDRLPAWQEYPKDYRKTYYVTSSVQANLIVFNTKQGKSSDFSAWSDLANPKWKGKLVLVDPRISLVIAGYYVMLDKMYGDAFIKSLAAQNPTLVNGGSPAAQLIAAGEAAVGFPIVPSVMPALRAAGAPVDSIVPNPTSGPTHYDAIPAKAPHPNAAKLFLNFMLTKAGQAAFNGNDLGATPLAGVSGVLQVPPSFIPLDESIPDSEIKRVNLLLGLQ